MEVLLRIVWNRNPIRSPSNTGEAYHHPITSALWKTISLQSVRRFNVAKRRVKNLNCSVEFDHRLKTNLSVVSLENRVSKNIGSRIPLAAFITDRNWPDVAFALVPKVWLELQNRKAVSVAPVTICECDILASWLIVSNGWVVTQNLTDESRECAILVENEAVIIVSNARLSLALLSFNWSQLEIGPWLILAVLGRSILQQKGGCDATVSAGSSEDRHLGTVRQVRV